MGKYMKFYSKLDLPELRRRQELNEQQTIIACKMKDCNRGCLALIRLQRIARLLAAVVYFKYT